MTATICGHERADLIWALATIQNDPATAEKMRAAPFPLFQPADMPTTIHKHRVQAIRAANDPAKLAAIIAELLRERGVRMMLVGIASESVIHAHVRPTTIHRWLMPAARRFALALLDAPVGANVEQMLAEVAR